MEKCRENVETAAQQTELLSEEAVEQMSNQELLFLYRESGDEELKWKLVLRMTGMVLAIEPMINMGTWKVKWLDDEWTVISEDHSPSAHYENTVLITDGEPAAASSAAEVYPSEGGQRGSVHADGAHAQKRGNGGPSGRDKRGIWGYAL